MMICISIRNYRLQRMSTNNVMNEEYLPKK